MTDSRDPVPESNKRARPRIDGLLPESVDDQRMFLQMLIGALESLHNYVKSSMSGQELHLQFSRLENFHDMMFHAMKLTGDDGSTVESTLDNWSNGYEEEDAR